MWCLVKITDSNNPDITDVNDMYFTVCHLYDQGYNGWTNYNGKDINGWWKGAADVLEPDPTNGIWFNVRGYEWATIHHFGKTFNDAMNVPTTMMSSSIGAIALDSFGDVWVSSPNSHDTDNLSISTDHYLSVFRNGGWERIDGAPKFILDIEFDSNGVPWFAAYQGIYKYENDTWTHFGHQDFQIPDNDAKLLEISKDGSIWFSYNQANFPGLYSLSNGEITHYTDINGISLNNITSIYMDNRDYFWITTNESVTYFDGNNWYSFTKDNGLPVDSINDIAVNLSGTFWLATNDGAIFYDGSSFEKFDIYNSPLYSNTVVLTTIDADNNVWFVTPLGISMNEQSQITSVEKEKGISLSCDIITNYPNPFNPITNISFSLSEDAFTTLIIYNINGQKVCNLISGFMQAGIYSVPWDGKDSWGNLVSSGIYFSRLCSSGNNETGKMILLR
ncbi:two-component regulator propeller domain-containing protein [Candidatus Latescibacterota bacterium]